MTRIALAGLVEAGAPDAKDLRDAVITQGGHASSGTLNAPAHRHEDDLPAAATDTAPAPQQRPARPRRTPTGRFSSGRTQHTTRRVQELDAEPVRG